MHIVVDSNVVKGYYEQFKNGRNDLTFDPSDIFEKSGVEYKICVDKGGKIEHEWRGPVDNQWFDNYIDQMFLKDEIKVVDVNNYEGVENNIRELGFPVDKWDIWFVRLSITLSEKQEEVPFVCEDIDFYEPSQKEHLNGQDRFDFMVSRKGSVLSYLSGDHSVEVMPVVNFLG